MPKRLAVPKGVSSPLLKLGLYVNITKIAVIMAPIKNKRTSLLKNSSLNGANDVTRKITKIC